MFSLFHAHHRLLQSNQSSLTPFEKELENAPIQ